MHANKEAEEEKKEISKSKNNSHFKNAIIQKYKERETFLNGKELIEVNMESSTNNQLVFNQKTKAAFKVPVSDKWGIFGTSQFQIQTNHTTRIVIGLLTVFVITSLILNGRVQSLVNRNEEMEKHLKIVEEHLRNIMIDMAEMQKMNVFGDSKIGIDRKGSVIRNTEEEDVDGDESFNALNQRVKRSYKEPSSDETSFSPLSATNLVEVSNGTNSNSGFKSHPSLPPGYGEPRLTMNNRKRERGNSFKRQARKFPNLDQIKVKNDIRLAKLKIKLEAAKERSINAKAKALKLQAEINSTRSYDARAAYLTVRDPIINIQNPKQHIGPWYIADSGKDIGFNDLWYQNLELDENGTSVLFQESGLYLIYAQVYYKSALKKKDKPTPLGFRIYLKKDSTVTKPLFQRPIPIAECVPSFPTTFYQTCFTQICWFVEKGDSIYLEHYTDAMPVISAEEMGQTFLGIVRLSP